MNALLTSRALMTLAFMLLFAGSAIAGSYIDTSSARIARTDLGDGTYEVTFTFRVVSSPFPPTLGGTIKSNIRVVEVDPCFDDKIFSAPVCITFPPSGTTGSVQTFTFFYPCSWGNDIGVTVSNKTGFTGVRKEEIDLAFGASSDDCGPGSRTGGLTLTPRASSDEIIREFFMPGEEEPVIPVTHGFCAATGEEHVRFTTNLPDPGPLGFSFYELTVFDGQQVLYQEQLCAAGADRDPAQIPDQQRQFGPPVRGVEVPNQIVEFAFQPHATIDMIDASGNQIPIPVFQGAINHAQPEIVARAGNLNTANGPPYDALMINGSLGDEFRTLDVDRNGPLQVSFLNIPGGFGQPYDYALFVLVRENTANDLTPQPFGLGTACFSTPLTGGSSITLLNTLGAENLLGSPVISNTPQAPGIALVLSRPNGLPPIDLTLQALVPDGFSPNRLAGISNAVVARIR